jgi:D-alanyl-D-alanine carboxypeptidase
VALAGCVHAPAHEPRAALDDAMDRHAASLPADRGLAFRVEAPRINLVWVQARGADIRPDQTVRIASITKTFVAAATLRLVERGQLRLDERIQPLLSAPIAARLAADGYELQRITMRMLLTHTAGLFDYAEHPDYQARVGSDPSHIWTREEQIAFAVDHGDPLSAPGVAFAYSDTGYLLLGDILERVTGTPMAEAVRTLLEFQSHALSHTWFESSNPNPRARRLGRLKLSARSA